MRIYTYRYGKILRFAHINEKIEESRQYNTIRTTRARTFDILWGRRVYVKPRRAGYDAKVARVAVHAYRRDARVF